MLTPSASSTSALPHADELDLLPCCTTNKHRISATGLHLHPEFDDPKDRKTRYLSDLGAGGGGEDGGTGGDVDGVSAVAASPDNVYGVVQPVDPDAAAQHRLRQPHYLKQGDSKISQASAEIQSIPVPKSADSSALRETPDLLVGLALGPEEDEEGGDARLVLLLQQQPQRGLRVLLREVGPADQRLQHLVEGADARGGRRGGGMHGDAGGKRAAARGDGTRLGRAAPAEERRGGEGFGGGQLERGGRHGWWWLGARARAGGFLVDSGMDRVWEPLSSEVLCAAQVCNWDF